jgi:DNA polymerase-3 subunit delta
MANPKANPLISVLTILFNFFSKLLLVQVATQQDERTIASAIGVNVFFVKDYFLAKRNYSLAKNINIVSYLKKADLEAKGVETSTLSDLTILKNLIFKILH